MAAFFKKNLKRIIVIGSALALCLTVLLVVFLSGSIEAEINENKNSLSISSYYLSKKPVFDSFVEDLGDYTLGIVYEGFKEGQNIYAHEYPKIKSGIFKNDNYSEYALHKYARVKIVIVLTRKGTNSKIVFNLKSEKATREFYDKLKRIIDS